MSGLLGKLGFFAMLLAGGAVVWFGVSEGLDRLKELAYGHPSSDWPTTQGRVTHSIIASGSEQSGLYFRYDYSVEGRDYTGERVSFGPVRKGRVVEEYPQGTDVTVYYDPAKPSDSVLEPGLSPLTYVRSLGVPALVVILGLVIVFLTVRLPFRAQQAA